MGFDSLVRKGVALANKITNALQVDVTHKRWTGTDVGGEDIIDGGVTLSALVEFKTKRLGRTGGQQYNTAEEEIQQAVITIVGPITDLVATGRTNPIDSRDQFILPGGETGPILNVEGIVDPNTGSPYMYEVSLGV